mmetsp:Transcript_92935/g.300525  ORF Transcript_92935/g.300525 Transcript_92935/m.300525 type:complete len:200 (-) Transcript_92935:176-775(-)
MHFGAVVRTTHVTGTATDIGSTAGRAAMILLRRGCRLQRLSAVEQAELEVDRKKLQILLPLFSGFVFGAGLGAFLHTRLGVHAFLVPAAVTGSAGLVYMFFRTKLKMKLKQIEERRLQAEITEVEDALERAHSFLHHEQAGSETQGTGRHSHHSRDTTFDHVEGQIESALEAVHDVEATITELWAAGATSGGDSRRSRT